MAGGPPTRQPPQHVPGERHNVLAIGLDGDALQALRVELALRQAPVVLVALACARASRLDTDPRIAATLAAEDHWGARSIAKAAAINWASPHPRTGRSKQDLPPTYRLCRVCHQRTMATCITPLHPHQHTANR
jgi:hypothetical protein